MDYFDKKLTIEEIKRRQNYVDENGVNAFMYIIRNIDEYYSVSSEIRAIMDIFKNSLKRQDNDGMTALMHYLKYTRSNIRRAILEYLSDELCIKDKKGKYAINYYIENVKSIGYIISFFSPEYDLIENISGKTILMSIAEKHKMNESFIKLFKQYIGKVDNDGNTALIYAAKNHNITTQRAIIALKDEIGHKNNYGWTAAQYIYKVYDENEHIFLESLVDEISIPTNTGKIIDSKYNTLDFTYIDIYGENVPKDKNLSIIDSGILEKDLNEKLKENKLISKILSATLEPDDFDETIIDLLESPFDISFKEILFGTLKFYKDQEKIISLINKFDYITPNLSCKIIDFIDFELLDRLPEVSCEYIREIKMEKLFLKNIIHYTKFVLPEKIVDYIFKEFDEKCLRKYLRNIMQMTPIKIHKKYPWTLFALPDFEFTCPCEF